MKAHKNRDVIGAAAHMVISLQYKINLPVSVKYQCKLFYYLIQLYVI